MSLKFKVSLFIILILVLDQVFKIIIKTTMFLGESHPVLGRWFILHFIENNGMAFGFEFGGQVGKVILTLFRLVAVAGLIWFIGKMISQGAPVGFVMALGAITAGAAGNIFDSAFYGMIFSESYLQNPMIEGSGVAGMFPDGGGYGKFLQGKVVDMLYFPIIRGEFPQWFPWRAGESFIFFRPVFNLADSAITCGVFWVLIFQRKFLKTL